MPPTLNPETPTDFIIYKRKEDDLFEIERSHINKNKSAKSKIYSEDIGIVNLSCIEISKNTILSNSEGAHLRNREELIRFDLVKKLKL